MSISVKIVEHAAHHCFQDAIRINTFREWEECHHRLSGMVTLAIWADASRSAKTTLQLLRDIAMERKWMTFDA